MNSLTTVRRIAWGVLRRKRLSLMVFALSAAAFHALVAISFPGDRRHGGRAKRGTHLPSGLRSLLKIAPNLQAGFGLLDYMAFSWMHPVFLGLGAAFVVARATDALAGGRWRGGDRCIMCGPNHCATPSLSWARCWRC